MTNSWKCAAATAISLVLVGAAITVSALTLTDTSSQTDIKYGVLQVTDDTPIGFFIGKVSSSPHNGRQYVAYKGIPFARPPVGDLRFSRPIPLPRTVKGKTVNPVANTNSCWSVTKTSTSKYYGEDCLYINIYTPYDSSSRVSVSNPHRAKLPVMVWLHGGGFVAGSVYPEPIKLVTRGQVIVVMVNYRMGVFGFLTTEDDVIPGNNGLWDQYLAIKWVSENIRHLHGDDTSITVFGQSAGSISAALHAISPVTSPYFQKAILQSGAATSPLVRGPKQRAVEFGNLVGCPHRKYEIEFVSCLRNLSIADILQNDKPDSFNMTAAQKQADFVWSPVIDGEMIVDDPLRLLSNHTYLNEIGAYNKDYMIGVLNDEGAIIPDNFLHNIPLSNLSNVKFYNDLAQHFIKSRYGNDIINSKACDKLTENINEFYTGQKRPTMPVNVESVLDMSSDFLFFIPSTEMAMAVSRCSGGNKCLESGPGMSEPQNCPLNTSSRTFFYHFDFCPAKDPCKTQCMTHGSEFAYEFPRENFTDRIEQKLSNMFVDLLTTFSRNSEPGQVVTCGWPVFETSLLSYLRIDPYPSVRRNLYNSRTTLWFKRIPEVFK